MKQACVIGLGSFGSHIAQTLAALGGCEVLAIDIDAANVARVRDLVHQALICDARDFDALRAAVPDDIDEAIVSLGEDLGASILCSLHLKNLGVKSIRAKAYNDDHAQVLKAIGVREVIFPERETAERMASRLLRPNLLEFFPLGEEYEVIEIPVPNSFVGKDLASAGFKTYKTLILAIKRPGSTQMRFMPGGDYELKAADILVVMGKNDALKNLSEQS